MARVKYYDSTTQTWKYADMALQTGIHVGTTAPTNEAMLWVDTASNQIDSFPLTDVQDSDGNSLIVNQIAVIPTTPSGTNAGDILEWDGDEWVTKPKWQMIYQPCEWIENTGSSFIKTDVIPQSGDILTVDFQMTEIASNGAVVAGTANAESGATQRFIIGHQPANEGSHWQAADSSWRNSSVAADTNRHIAVLDMNNGSLKIDGTEVVSWTVSLSTLNNPLAIFAKQYSSTSATIPAKAKVTSAKLERNGATLLDMISAYNIFTGEAGMYDRAVNKFYGNSGSGSFAHGNDVN